LSLGLLLQAGFEVGDQVVFALLDLVLGVERRSLLRVALLLQFIDVFLGRDFALQVDRQTLGFLRVAYLDLQVLELALQILFQVVGPTIQLVGLGVKERFVAPLAVCDDSPGLSCQCVL